MRRPSNKEVIVKKCAVSLLLLASCPWAFAIDDPLPGQMQFRDFPPGARLIVKKDIPLLPLEGFKGRSFGVVAGTVELLFHFDDNGKPDPEILRAGRVFKIESAHCTNEKGFAFCGIATEPKRGEGYLYLAFETHTNAFAFTVRRALDSSFDVVWDDPNGDPYRGMDPAIALDIMLKKIATALEAGTPEKALPEFERIEKMGRPLPERFHYYYAEAYSRAGKKSEARDRARQYLNTYGKAGKYYDKVIEMLAK